MDKLKTILAIAEKLADGELYARTEIPYDASETGRLAEAIDRLAGNLQAYRRHIEQITKQSRRSLHAHRTLSASNRALLRATDEISELQEVCRLIVEEGSYPFAWVGYAEQDDRKSIRPVAHYGMDGNFLDQLDLTWDNSGPGQDVTGTAIRSGKPALIRNAVNDARTVAWLEVTHMRGFTSLLGLPLKISGQVAGALVICAEDPDAFDDDEIRLLEEAVADLAFAIETVRARQRQREVEEAYRRISHQNALILESAAEGIYGIDTAGTVNFINAAAAALLGYEKDELLGRNAHEMMHHSTPDGAHYPIGDCPIYLALTAGNAIQRIQDIYWRKDGSPLPVEISSTPIVDNGTLLGAVITLTDISERKRYLAQLERKSNFDDLTGLPNRNLLNDRMAHAIDRCRQEDRMLAALVINLNQFRNIIDSLGHNSGDLILQGVADRLRGLEGETDTLARAGGDEFVWILEIAHEEEAAVSASAVLEAVTLPFTVEGREVFLSASIGIGIFPKDGEDGDLLLKNATAAMHRAKILEDHRFSFYTAEVNARALERLDLESALRRALEKDELVLHYQPQLSLRTGEIFGAEVLLRWQHPQRGMVPPAQFIPLAESTGLIVPLGEWVLRKACLQNKAWQNAGLPCITVAVNMSARQFDTQNIVAKTVAILQETGLDPQYLELELTESTIMSDADAFIDAVKKLRSLAITLSIDDFGTGYSSLSYLKRFAIHRLKIDQSFVRDITHDPNAAAITMAIMALAKSLKLSSIAEGVETAAQLNFLRTHGCDEMQGYYFSRPLPAAEFEQLLRDGHKLTLPTTRHKPEKTLLLVDDAPATLAALKHMLRGEGYTILTAESGLEGLNLLASNEAGVVISEACMSLANGPDFLSTVREMYPNTVRIILSSHSELQAVSKGEIYKFLTKPWDDDKLLKVIQNAFRHFESQRRKNKP